MTPWLLRLGLFGATAAVGIALGVAFDHRATVAVLLDGHPCVIRVEDREALRECLRLRAARARNREVYLRGQDEVFELTAAELGYDIEPLGALGEAQKSALRTHRAADANPTRWLARRWARGTPTVSVALPVRFDEERARRALERLRPLIDRPAHDARLLIDEHRIEPSQIGAKLSIEATLVRLAHQDLGATTIVDAVVDRIEPAVTEDDLLPVDVTRVLASFETSFAKKAGPRAVNIRQAAKLLDGAVILPGETLSFNDRVGNRIHGRGFVDAPVIVNDELEEDVGGGVCQVATTLHAAAVYGNLTVVSRRSHSRPSGYAPIGLDATVIDGKVDLLLRNPYDEPLLVHTSFPSRFVIRIELLGRDPSAQVEHAAAVTHVEPFGRRLWIKENLPPGTFQNKQDGSPGMDVISVLRIRLPDGQVERRTYFSKYYPVPEVFHAGPGTPASALPPLPEGARGVTIDGEENMAPSSLAPGDSGILTEESVPSLDEADGLSRQAPARG